MNDGNNNTLGFIGLGTMGFPMAVNLMKRADTRVCGYNRSHGAMDRFVLEGGASVDSIEELCERSNIIFLCLPTNDALEHTIESILSSGKSGMILVDLGSTSPVLIRRLHDNANKCNISLLDSPVSGGQSGAEAATLSIMCGGDKAVFDIIKPYLEAMGSVVTYMGPSGCGSTAKLANNMIVEANLVSVSESYALAVKAGIDPSTLFKAIKSGFAQSTVMDTIIPKILSRDFSPTARIQIHVKDLTNSMRLAQDLEVDLPLSKVVLYELQSLANMGIAGEDQSAVVKYYEDKMKITVR